MKLRPGAKNHNFRWIFDKRTKPGMKRYHCDQCQSIVEMPAHLSQRDVNQHFDDTELSNLPCLPPMVEPQEEKREIITLN